VAGEIIPVLNIRKQLGLRKKNIALSDRVVIAEASAYAITFFVDAITGIMDLPPHACKPPENIFPNTERYIRGVARLNEIMVLIYDINTLFPEQIVADMVNQANPDKERP